MRHVLFIILSSLAGIIVFASCSDNKPESLMPLLSVVEAQDITRTTAVITGSALQNGDESITSLSLRYGTTESMDKTISFSPKFGTIKDTIENLTANTKYFYCLEAKNEYSKAQSNILNFTTEPNVKPTLGGIKMLSQGPLSIILQYEIKDNGGEALTGSGLYYKSDNGEEQSLKVSPFNGNLYRARIGDLKSFTQYTVQAYATNSYGESRSEMFSFQTGNAVVVTIPGMLNELISDTNKYEYSSICISGPLNGSDLRFLRDMAGKDISDADTKGQLKVIDLSDASIVSGGLSYNGTRYTANDTISYGIFKDCSLIEKIILPDNAKVIEENAVLNCTSLKTLQVPAATIKIMPSSGCTSLQSISVSEANTAYTSKDGVLYDKGITKIIWFPMGKSDSFSLPATITSLGQYAFIGCKLQEITLPNTIETVPYALFQNCSNLKNITLGSGTNLISSYCFSGCPLSELHVKATIPPSCTTESFSGVTNIYTNCTLYIPQGCKSLYRSSDKWNKFQKIVEE